MMALRPTPTTPNIPQLIALFYILFAPLFLLSHVVSCFSPETWLVAIKTAIVIWSLGYLLHILIQLTSIPLLKLYETETYWVYRHVSYPRWIVSLNTFCSFCMAVRGWILFVGGATGALWFVYLYLVAALEVDLFVVVLAHWTAVLVCLVRTEEWSAGGELLLGNWRAFSRRWFFWF